MFRAFERDQRLIQTIRLPVSPAFAPVVRVAGEPKQNFMMAQILSSLVGIATASSRRADQSQPQSFVVRFIGCVLTVSEHGYAIGAVLIRQIDPLMGSDFELTLFSIPPLHRTDVPIVSSHLVRGSEWKGGFQIRLFGFPIDRVSKFHAI